MNTYVTDLEYEAAVDQITQRLRRLRHVLPEVIAAFVLTSEGLPVSAVTPPGVDEEMTSASAAALLGLARKVAKSLQQGRLSQMVIQGDGNDLVISGGVGDAVLAAVLEKGATLGLVAVEVQRAADEVLGLV
jgi:predicted regulator of Ras-like GTPase activity (Roadblock/LC7/MglB family)